MKECNFCGDPTELAIKMENDWCCVRCLKELLDNVGNTLHKEFGIKR